MKIKIDYLFIIYFIIGIITGITLNYFFPTSKTKDLYLSWLILYTLYEFKDDCCYRNVKISKDYLGKRNNTVKNTIINIIAISIGFFVAYILIIRKL